MCKCINRYMTQSLYVHTRCKITALDLYTMSRRRIQLIKMFVRVAHTITSKCHSTLWQQVIIQMCGTLSESLLILKSEWNREGVFFFFRCDQSSGRLHCHDNKPTTKGPYSKSHSSSSDHRRREYDWHFQIKYIYAGVQGWNYPFPALFDSRAWP